MVRTLSEHKIAGDVYKRQVLEKIVRAADISKEDFVLEIGPGIGTMTQYLAENARQVVAVEIDRNLIRCV